MSERWANALCSTTVHCKSCDYRLTLRSAVPLLIWNRCPRCRRDDLHEHEQDRWGKPDTGRYEVMLIEEMPGGDACPSDGTWEPIRDAD